MRRLRAKSNDVVKDIIEKYQHHIINQNERDDMINDVLNYPNTDLSMEEQKKLYDTTDEKTKLTKKKDLEIIESQHAVYRRILRDIDKEEMEKQLVDKLVCRYSPNHPNCEGTGKPKLRGEEKLKGEAGTAVVRYDLEKNPAGAFIITQWK